MRMLLTKSWKRKVLLAVFLIALCNCFLTAQDPRRPKQRRIQVEPQMSEAIKFEYGNTLMLWLNDNSVLVVDGMADPLLPHKRVHLAVWSLNSLKSFNEVIVNNGPATFGTPSNIPTDALFKWTILEATPASVEAVFDAFDVSFRTGLVDRKFGMLRVQRDRVKGFTTLLRAGPPHELTENDFQRLP